MPPHPDTAPDFGTRNAAVIAERALGARLVDLAGRYGTTFEGMQAFFARHGEPPPIDGRLRDGARPRPARIPPTRRDGRGFLDRSQPPEREE